VEILTDILRFVLGRVQKAEFEIARRRVFSATTQLWWRLSLLGTMKAILEEDKLKQLYLLSRLLELLDTSDEFSLKIARTTRAKQYSPLRTQFLDKYFTLQREILK